MPKRHSEDIDIEDFANGVTNIDGLLELNRDERAAVLGYIADIAGTSMTSLKKARTWPPSFSGANWANFALQYGLHKDASMLDLELFSTPRYYLPPSLHVTMFENAWRWQDVYREKGTQSREEAAVRILDPYIVPIVALFQGRIIDKPEQAMDGSKYSTGGEVEHEIFMIGGILFFIVECKASFPDPNALAQLFLNLSSAAEMNSSMDFKGLRIYGLLTDLGVFKFYSYDPDTKQFYFDETITINRKRTDACSDMIEVSNKIFGVILTAYIDGLHACIKKSKDKAGQGNTPTSSQKPSHKSTDQWEAALTLALTCRAKFEEPVTGVDDIEEKANEALALLTQSACCLPRASDFTGVDEPSKPADLKILATRVTKETHEKFLSKSKQ